MTTTNKECRECNHVLPLQDFYQHPAMADGYLNKCKECVKCRVKIHRDNNINRIREYDRKRQRNKIQKSKPNTEQHNKASQKWAKKHPRKRRATARVHQALKVGKIKRPEKCEDCGKICIPEAHHFNYNKPLNVVWICSGCHARRHWK